MKKVLAALCALALGALLAATTAPAFAGTSGDENLTLTTHDLTLLPDHCGDAAFSVSGPFADASNWNVDVTVYDPYGVDDGGDYFYDSDGTTSGSAYLCQGIDRPGRYRVTAEYEMSDADYNLIAHRTVTGYFTFGTRAKAASSLSRTVRAYGKHSWRIRGHLTRAGRSWAGHRVRIQAYVYGSWTNIGTKTTNRYGNVSWTSTPERGAGSYRVRLHSAGGTYVRDANSTVFHLPHR